MSFLPFLNNKKEEIALLLDIGNGSVTSALAVFSDGNIPEILYTMSLPFAAAQKPDADRLIENLTMLLESSLADVIKQGFDHQYFQIKKKSIEHVLVSFSSPWFFMKAKPIYVNENEAFTINNVFVQSVIDAEETSFKQELKNLTNETGAFSIIEKSIIHTKVNGYTLDNSLNKKAKIFDATVCLSAIPSKLAEKVTDIIIKHTHILKEKIFPHTFPVISFSVVQENFAVENNFLLVDVTGEITDIALVSSNVIVSTVSFPLGRNSIIRQVAKTIGVSFEIALSTLTMFVMAKADDRTADSIREILARMEKEWTVYFEDALLTLSPKLSIPSKVYLTADPDTASIFIEFLKTEKQDSTANFKQNIKITHLNPETLAPLCRTNPLLTQNEFVAVLAIFYNSHIFSS